LIPPWRQRASLHLNFSYLSRKILAWGRVASRERKCATIFHFMGNPLPKCGKKIHTYIPSCFLFASMPPLLYY
jgi:hypothetical protein